MPCRGGLAIATGRTLLAGALGCALPAAADEFDVVNFTAGATMLYDDNVFRVSRGGDLSRVTGSSARDDLITVTSAGIRVNQPVSLQRFEFEARVVDYRYDRFDFLSFTALNYTGTWRWGVTPRFSGVASTERSQQLNSFVDFAGFVRNIRTDEVHRFNGEYQIDGVWRLVGGVSRTERRNSQPFIQELDNRLDRFEGGLKYAFPAGSHVTVGVREGRGSFLNRSQPTVASLLDTGFRDTERDARLYWQLGGRSFANARIAHLSRKHGNFSQRDYSGVVGRISLSWGMTGKSSVVATLERDLSSFQQASSSYIVSNRLSIEPIWEITAKVAARARVEVLDRQFRGAVAPTAQNDRVDTISSVSASVDWRPRRYAALSVSLQHDRRASTVPGFDFRSNQVTLAAQFTF